MHVYIFVYATIHAACVNELKIMLHHKAKNNIILFVFKLRNINIIMIYDITSVKNSSSVMEFYRTLQYFTVRFRLLIKLEKRVIHKWPRGETIIINIPI